MPTPFSLPLDLDNRKNFEALLRGIEDRNVRIGIARATTMPKAVVEIASMVDDSNFLNKAEQAIRTYSLFLNGTVKAEDVKTAGKDLADYTQATYPEGLQALKNYASSIAPQVFSNPSRSAVISPDLPKQFVANLAVVANAVVYVNAAIATNVGLAAEAVAVLGIFVI